MSSLVCGLHHVGINVPDLEAGRRFYESVFGFEVVGVDNWEEGNEVINDCVGLDESSARSYLLKGSNTYLEIWHYDSPPSRGEPGERCAADYGYTHLCFTVKDFDAVMENFVAAGGAPIRTMKEAHPSGVKIQYCRDPFGNIIELLEVPEGAINSLERLPAIEREAVYSPPPSKYFAIENGRFEGMRSRDTLPDPKEMNVDP